MAYFERIRDVVAEPFSSDVIRQRTAAGWQMVSIEWRRELPDSEMPSEGAYSEEIPYGLHISEDCKRLEVDAHENQVLLLMMDLLAQDFSYSAIVDSREFGPRWLTGGNYGPAASVLLALLLVVAIPLLIRLTDEYAWRYTRKPLISAGIPVDIPAPAAHAAVNTPPPPPPSLIQIQPIASAPVREDVTSD